MRERLKQVRRGLADEMVARARRLPVRSDHVLYEANSGGGALCNPEAIFRALLAAPDMGHLTHIWTLATLDPPPAIVREFAGDRRVRFVRHRSPGYHAALATAGWLVNNATFPPELAKRDRQVYVNTWHGTPLKKMGYDIAGGGPATRNIVRNFLAADFIVSPNEFTTRQMLRTAYRLDGIYRGAVVEEGYPRLDRQLLDEGGRAAVRKQLADAGVTLDAGERVLLYAPTWKGESFYDPRDDVADLAATAEQLQAELPGWRVLLRVHPRVLAYARGRPGLAGLLVPDEIPANPVLGVTDLLVTDYSSIFYDFGATGRPTVFLIPDLDEYADRRGLYVPVRDWPGPVATTVPEVAALVRAVGTGTAQDPAVSHAAALEASRARYTPHDDGHAAERVVDIVFRGREKGRRVRRDFGTVRPSVLLCGGSLAPGEGTGALLGLLGRLDHGRFDVSLAYDPSARNAETVAGLDPAVRLLPRVGRFVAPRRPGRADPGSRAARKAFREEWRRCFGAARFDHVVDGSGDPGWAGVLAASGRPVVPPAEAADLLRS